MTVRTLPLTRQWFAKEFGFDLGDIRNVADAPYVAGYQEYPIIGSYNWSGYLTFAPAAYADRVQMQAWFNAACDAGDLVRMPHPRFRVPFGTMRGSPTLYGDHAAGASVLTIQSTGGATLLGGDLIGLDGHLLMVVTALTFDPGTGRASVEVRGKLRKAVPSGTPVQWDAPTATFQILKRPSVVWVPGSSPEFSIEFVERFLTS